MEDEINWQDFERITKSVFDILLGNKVQFICCGQKCFIKNDYGNNQFDVLFRWDTEFTNSLVAVECKYWSSTVDKEEIRAFESKCNDCKIGTRFIVSKNGFTDRAVIEAKGKNIDLIELRQFSEDDFLNYFKDFPSNVTIDLLMHRPKVECSINIQLEEIDNEEHNSIKSYSELELILKNGETEKLSKHLPAYAITEEALMKEGFEKIDFRTDDYSNTSIFRKTLNCQSILYRNEAIRVKTIFIDVKIIYDNRDLINHKINIDFEKEVLQAGILIAKKIQEKSKTYVLNMKEMSIIREI